MVFSAPQAVALNGHCERGYGITEVI